MRHRDKLEQYEATEAQDILQFLARMQPQHEARAPAHFRTDVLRKAALRPSRQGVLAWLQELGTAAWTPVLATALLLSLGFNAWLGWSRRVALDPMGQQVAYVQPESNSLTFNTYDFQTSIHSQTPLATIVAVHSVLQERVTAFGFAQTPTVKPALLGMLYVEAMAALRSNDIPLAAQRVAVLHTGLSQAPTPSALITYVDTLRTLLADEKVDGTTLTALFLPFATMYAEHARNQGGDHFAQFHLGIWISNMSLAAAAGDTAALHQGNIAPALLQAMQQLQVPKGLLEALERLKVLLGQATLSERDIAEVLKLLKRMQTMVG